MELRCLYTEMFKREIVCGKNIIQSKFGDKFNAQDASCYTLKICSILTRYILAIILFTSLRF